MSGWIKLEKDRRDDPRVLRMARELRHAGVTHERFTSAMHVTLVLGCLDVLWCYADTHIRDDDTLDIGTDEIDEIVGLQGFASLMPIDWLEVIDANCVKLPDFHAHNGTESRKKALAQKRQERHRNAPVTPASRSSVTTALPDLDQTRPRPDQKEKEQARKPRPDSRIPNDFELTPERREVAEREKLDAERVFANFRDYWTAASGPKARKMDWDATWRVWCRSQIGGRNGTSGKGSEPKLSAVERVYRATEGVLGGIDPGYKSLAGND